jgi:hypothetical protein
MAAIIRSWLIKLNDGSTIKVDANRLDVTVEGTLVFRNSHPTDGDYVTCVRPAGSYVWTAIRSPTSGFQVGFETLDPMMTPSTGVRERYPTR